MGDPNHPDNAPARPIFKKGWLVVGVITLVALLTNPGIEQHKSAVKEIVSAVLGKALKEQKGNQEANAFAGLGLALGAVMVNTAIDAGVSSRNLLLLSLTKISFAGESRIIGVGLFGNVFIFDDKLDADKLMKESN